MAREVLAKIAYVPFKTFLTALDTLRQGVPDPVDKSVFRNQSFSTQTMLISSLKALGTLDEGGHPQPILARLVDPASRKDALGDMLQDKYRAVLDLGLAASDKQVEDKLRELGVGGATLEKAKSFFLQAASMAGIPLSPHIAGVRTISENGEGGPKPVARRRKARAKSPGAGGGVGAIAEPKQSAGTSAMVVHFKSGGTATLFVNADWVTISTEDRDALIAWIDAMKAYAAKNPPPKNQEPETATSDS